ncbi:MAG: hypothetical protein HAW63_05305 [Bdellovibrionaceae bacterium]|nr:hypothetical protein [Pseudobdellovibrionaceae bacterium]
MSRLGKVLLIVAGLSVLLLAITRFILGGWLNFMFFPLGIFLVSSTVGFLVDVKFYFEFLTTKTTKNGLNMFSAVLLFFVSLSFVNYLAVQYSTSWDLTQGKINSVSKETVAVLNSLKKPIRFKIFYRGEKDKPSKVEIINQLNMYKQASTNISVESIDAYVDNISAKEYLKDIAQMKTAVVFAEYLKKKVKIKAPLDEEKITKAIVKLTRNKTSTIYFITGHSERSLSGTGLNGLSNFKLALEDFSFKAKELNLIKSLAIPDDADAIAIIGSRGAFLAQELDLLLGFLKKGGSLFLAIDPGTKHNLALLTKSLGVEFKNNYTMNNRLQVKGRGRAGALGLIFSKTSSITKDFEGQQFMLLDLASELVPAPLREEHLKVKFLVQSAPNSYSVNELSEKAIKEASLKERGIILGVSVEGSILPIKKAKTKAKKFLGVIFGDSDFLSNKDWGINLNSRVALNSLEFLLKEDSLINIKPKKPKGTKVTLTSSDSKILIVFGIFIPLLSLILATVLWFRRRNA